VEAGRLSGFLQVSRALGDLDCATRRKPAGLTGEPELSSRQIKPQDEFIIVGTDGLWDCISNVDAVRS
jgi:serine/threonine protein phosphatase PrpC